MPSVLEQPAPLTAPLAAASAPPSVVSHYPRQIAATDPRVWRGVAPKITPRHLLAGAAMAVLSVAACWWAWADAASLVDPLSYNSHVLLAPLVVAYLAWVRRGRLPHVRVTGRPIGPAAVVLGWALLATGQAGGVSVMYHLGALTVAVGAVMSVCGKGLFLRFLPATAALLFLLPVPGVVRDELAGPLQATTARLAGGVLAATGQDVRVEGATLLIGPGVAAGAGPWRDVTVAEACNGMPMAAGLLTVTYAFAFSWPLKNRYRWLLLGVSPLVMLACNVLRTVPLVLLYAAAQDAGDPSGAGWRRAADAVHLYSGWLMLPAAFGLLAGLVWLLRWCDLRVEKFRLAAGA